MSGGRTSHCQPITLVITLTPPTPLSFRDPARSKMRRGVNLGWGIPPALSSVEGSQERNGVAPSLHPSFPCPGNPSSSSLSTKLEAYACAEAQAYASVFFSPSPLKALRERGTKGVRVPPGRRAGVMVLRKRWKAPQERNGTNEQPYTLD